MNLCQTINISPHNIIGDKDNISLKVNPQLVEDIKEMYGIDLENKKLLAHLKKFGSIKITSSAAMSLLNNCQTEDELVSENEEELKEAKAKLVPEEKEVLTDINGHYYSYYSYDHVESWVNSIRSYICDISNGMMSKETKRVILNEALEVIDLLRAAFKDSKETLGSPEFRIKA